MPAMGTQTLSQACVCARDYPSYSEPVLKHEHLPGLPPAADGLKIFTNAFNLGLTSASRCYDRGRAIQTCRRAKVGYDRAVWAKFADETAH